MSEAELVLSVWANGPSAWPALHDSLGGSWGHSIRCKATFAPQCGRSRAPIASVVERGNTFPRHRSQLRYQDVGRSHGGRCNVRLPLLSPRYSRFCTMQTGTILAEMRYPCTCCVCFCACSMVHSEMIAGLRGVMALKVGLARPGGSVAAQPER